MRNQLRDRKPALLFIALGILAILSSVFLAKNNDFQVYWYGVRDFLTGGRPLYGPLSGVGYPQEYRYPPITVLFFVGLTYLPLRIAGICWVLLAWAGGIAATRLAIRTWGLTFSKAGVAVGVILLIPYIVLAIKFGNIQPLLITLVFAALLWSERRPAWAGAALALAICCKVWPLFFVPWLLPLRRRATLRFAALASVFLWIAPALYFGWGNYWNLTRDFADHAFTLAANPENLWYSSQSLRGVLLRFFTHSNPFPDGYPDVSVAALPREVVIGAWLVLGGLVYGYVVVSFWRSKRSQAYLWDSLAFVCFSVLQSFCMNSSLISLWPAILAAMHVYSSVKTRYPSWARRAFLVACGLSLIGDVTFYRPVQRAALMLGIDFWVMVALGASLAIAGRSSLEEGNAPVPDDSASVSLAHPG